MPTYFEITYPGDSPKEPDAHFAYWITKGGYYYRQSMINGLIGQCRRVSYNEFFSAYEALRNY